MGGLLQALQLVGVLYGEMIVRIFVSTVQFIYFVYGSEESTWGSVLKISPAS